MLTMTRSPALQAGATFALAAISMSAAMARAQTLASTISATINKNGPRTGANGSTISNLVLSLTESNAAFTAPGNSDVFLSSSAGTATSSFKYDSTLASGRIETQLGRL